MMMMISLWAYHVVSKPWRKWPTPLKPLVPPCSSPKARLCVLTGFLNANEDVSLADEQLVFL